MWGHGRQIEIKSNSDFIAAGQIPFQRITHEDLSITELAEFLGYDSLFSFSVKFKKQSIVLEEPKFT